MDGSPFDAESLRKAVEALSRQPQTTQTTPGTLTMPSLVMLLGGNAADAGSTIYALQHGARETNPLFGPHRVWRRF